MTTADCIARLKEIPRSEYPRIWNELQNRAWPEELGDLPAELREEAAMNAIGYIQICVEEKELVRYRCLAARNTAEALFEAWWELREAAQKKADDSADDGTEHRRDYRNYAVNFAFSFFAGLFASFCVYTILKLL